MTIKRAYRTKQLVCEQKHLDFYQINKLVTMKKIERVEIFIPDTPTSIYGHWMNVQHVVLRKTGQPSIHLESGEIIRGPRSTMYLVRVYEKKAGQS